MINVTGTEKEIEYADVIMGALMDTVRRLREEARELRLQATGGEEDYRFALAAMKDSIANTFYAEMMVPERNKEVATYWIGKYGTAEVIADRTQFL